MNLVMEIEKSFPEIEKLMTKSMLENFTETAVWDLDKYNFGFGTLLRLVLLRKDSALYKSFCEAGCRDKVLMTRSLLLAFHEHMAIRLASFSS